MPADPVTDLYAAPASDHVAGLEEDVDALAASRRLLRDSLHRVRQASTVAGTAARHHQDGTRVSACFRWGGHRATIHPALGRPCYDRVVFDADATTLAKDREKTIDASEAVEHTLYARVVYSEKLAPDQAPIDTVICFRSGREHSLLLGRNPDADDEERCLAMRFDGWASRRHARLTLLSTGEKQGLVVADLGSRNGSHLNGKPVRGRAIARPSDVIRVGATVFVVGSAPLGRVEQILAAHAPPPDFDVRSWCALALWEQLARLAPTSHGVLLLGEMGTGKTRLARRLHERGPRRAEPFVSYNCSAIPANLEEATLFGVVGGFIPTVREKQGWLTLAGRGTLFLDELADMPLVAQAKLLDAFDPTAPSYVPVGGTRRLPTRCRLVSATNRDVFALASQGVVRHDLLSRLVVAQLTVPPLRERREDLLPVFYSAARAEGAPADAPGFVPSAEVAESLLLARWTENVRGLQSLAARVGLGERLTSTLVRQHADRGASSESIAVEPPSAAEPRRPAAPVAWPPTPIELLEVLAANDWQVTRAATALDKRRETVSRLVTVRFGGRSEAQKAYRVLLASGRVPECAQVETLYELFCERPETPPVLAAREAWRERGECPLTERGQ